MEIRSVRNLRCPECKTFIRRIRFDEKPVTPKEGDLAFCTDCGRPVKFTAQGRLETMTEGEILEALIADQSGYFLEMWRKVQSEREKALASVGQN